MKSEKLFNIIGYVSDEKIIEADTYYGRPQMKPGRFSFIYSPITALCAVVLIVAGAFAYIYNSQPPQEEKPPAITQPLPAVGDIIEFGSYDWRVLATQDGKALIITEEIIERRPYHSQRTDITWEHSDMRAYLNGEFLNRFSGAERERIAETRLVNNISLWNDVPGGKATTDRIFLLSTGEAQRYFADDEARKAYEEDGEEWFWWLRTPGDSGGDFATYVHFNGSFSDTNLQPGEYVDESEYGVRPAMWVVFAPPVTEVGSVIKFGDYNWRVLDMQGGNILIITEDVIEYRPYHSERIDITWEDSDMRAYLNGDFLDRFNDEDRARILKTTVLNNDSNIVPHGGNDTTDSVFLLSNAEADKYFTDNEARIAVNADGEKTTWWLRTTGSDSAVLREYASVVVINGYIYGFGFEVSDGYASLPRTGVRPAMWVSYTLPPEDDEPPPPATEIEYNNDAANLARSGWGGALAVTDGQWIYYTLHEGGTPFTDIESFLYRVGIDGTGDELIYNTIGEMRYLNLVDEWIYFTSYNEIYRIRTDGTDKTLVFDGNYEIVRMYIDGGWIYYIINNQENERNYDENSYDMYKIRLDGTDETYLTRSNHFSYVRIINIIGDRIYYRCLYDGEIYKIRTDGTDRQRFFNNPKLSHNIFDDWSYFADENDNNRLKKINMYSGEVIKLSDERIPYANGSLIHVVGDWVYYASRGASFIDGERINSIRKIRTDGTEETSLTGNMLGYYDEIYSMSVVGDWIYYELYTPIPGQKPFARIRTDGTGFMQIYENIYGDAPQINEDYVTIGGVDYSTDLTLLDLYDQGLTDEDIEPLRHMTNLTNLHLSMNSITDISVLSHLTKLETLSIQSNQITDISVVKEMPSLTVFFAGYNEITDISVLEGLHSLSTLSLGDNKISDISALKGLNLWLLDLCNNPIDDLSPLYEVSVSANLSLRGIDVQGFIFPDGLENLTLCAEYLTPANLEQLNELDVMWLTLFDCHRNAIFRRIIEDALPNRTHHTQEEDFIPNQTLIWFIEA